MEARKDSLTTQGELMVTIIDRAATVGEPEPAMDPAYASVALQMLANPKIQRARLFDPQGHPIADSELVADRVERRALPPARPRGDKGMILPLSTWAGRRGSVGGDAGAGARRCEAEVMLPRPCTASTSRACGSARAASAWSRSRFPSSTSRRCWAC